MANRIQGLIAHGLAIAVLAATASGVDFSHRAHLAVKLECTTCHISVTKSARVEDNNLPEAQVCLKCHEGPLTIKQPREMLLAHFPHDKHVGAIPCLTCHKGINVAEVTSKANFPGMAQCMVCHNQVDIPSSCYVCHAQTMPLEPALHGDGWVDAHSRVRRDVAQKQSCQMCHGRNFHCAGCH